MKTAGIEPEVEVWFLRKKTFEGPTSWGRAPPGPGPPPALAPASTPGLSTSQAAWTQPEACLLLSPPPRAGNGGLGDLQGADQSCAIAEPLSLLHRDCALRAGVRGHCPPACTPALMDRNPELGRSPSIYGPLVFGPNERPQRGWALRVCFSASLMLLGAF